MVRSFRLPVPSSRAHAALALATLLVAAPLACSDEPAAPAAQAGEDDGGGASRRDGGAATDSDGATAVPSSCPRTPKPDDHVRKVVVSHPFAEPSGKANVFEVLELSPDGALTKTGQTFLMRPAYQDIVFTPDGKVGFVAQDDSTIGVFAFDDAGKVSVVHEAFAGKWASGELVVSKDGQHLYVCDPNTESNGGGVRRMRIGCDGTLTDEGLVVPGGTAHQMALLPSNPERAVLIGYKASDSPANTYAHLLDLSASPPKRVASGAVFADQDAIASAVVVTPDGKYALVADDGFQVGSRMAPIALADMTKRATIATPSPSGLVFSPFGNALLLMNAPGGGDALRVVKYDPSNDAAPFAVGAQVATKGGNTQLPTIANVIDRGKLKGRVLVAEVSAVRQLAFAADGTITDVGAKLDWPDGNTNILGSLGVEP
jgi:DNA-binding beta-propeller fold protein YncE